MRILLDTHLLIWSAAENHKLSNQARTYIDDSRNTLVFSAASIWEIAIKQSRRSNIEIAADTLYQDLLANGYEELTVSGAHGLAIKRLPAIHQDPFDRILIAQAFTDNLVLLTADAIVARYGGLIVRV